MWETENQKKGSYGSSETHGVGSLVFDVAKIVDVWDCTSVRAKDSRDQKIRKVAINKGHFLWEGQGEQRERSKAIGAEGLRDHVEDYWV